MLWRMAAGDTHLYPGAQLRCLDQPSHRRLHAGDDVLVEFSDGNLVPGRITDASSTQAVLQVQAHATRRGAAIAARSWRLVPGASQGELRVKARAG